MINTLIVGLGNIGFKFDKDDIAKKITHASSVYHHKKFKLIGGVDRKENILLQFKKIYKVPYFKNLKTSLKHVKPQLIIFTNQPSFVDLLYVSKFESVKFILIEKPYEKNENKIKKILVNLKKNKVTLSLNFQRNFSKNYNKLIKEIKKGIIGNKFKTFCFHNKSFNTNGSHFLNIINLYSKNLKKIKKNTDTVHLNYKNGDAYFFRINDDSYNNNCMTIYGNKGKIEISSRAENCKIYTKTKDKFYKNYFILKKIKSFNLHEAEPQKPVLDNIYNVISNNKKVLFKENEMLNYLSIINKINN